MLWRAPWLRRRLALLGFAAWDIVTLFLSYNLIFLARLSRWEGLSPGLIVITTSWISISYIIGRYSPSSTTKGFNDSVANRVIRTLLTGIAVIAIFVGHSWAYQIVDAQTRFRGFLIPLMVSACISSTLYQLVMSGLASKKQAWLLLINANESKIISKELRFGWNSLGDRVSVTSKEEVLNKINNDSLNSRGIAIGNAGTYEEKATEKLLQLKEQGERIISLLNWCELELQRIPPELVHTDWLIQAEGFSLRPGSISWRVKRFGDILGAVILLMVTLPLIIIGIVLIWLEDKGPVFYKQIRSGLYGKPIRIWKLRSMRVDAERSGAQWASRFDPRITKVGRILRATRIDELPQLISVLSGDLSLIGPRPERPEIEQDLEIAIPNYRVRHWIRPGLSGWAQVCYPYGASTEDSRMKLSHDLYYLRNASLPLDILISLKTIRLVLTAKGARPRDTEEKRD